MAAVFGGIADWVKVRFGHRVRPDIELVTFHAQMHDIDAPLHPNANLENASYMHMIDILRRSARIFHPASAFTLLTTKHTDLSGLRGRFKRVDCGAAAHTIMYDRTRAQVGYLRKHPLDHPVLFLDSDILLTGSLRHLLEGDFDVALTFRDNREMPLNGGLLLANCRRPEVTRRFFERFLGVFEALDDTERKWFGDQRALFAVIGIPAGDLLRDDAHTVTLTDGTRIRMLPARRHNHSPKNRLSEIVKPFENVDVLHFKGERKRLMQPYFDVHLRHLESRWWRFGESRRTKAARRSLSERAAAEIWALKAAKSRREAAESVTGALSSSRGT